MLTVTLTFQLFSSLIDLKKTQLCSEIIIHLKQIDSYHGYLIVDILISL